MNLLITKFVYHRGTRINQYLFAVIISIPLLSFGMVQGWLSPMIASLKEDGTPSGTHYTTDEISWAASITYIFAIVLGAPMGMMMDRFGRKTMTLVTIFSLVLYWLIKLISLEPWALILARAVAGFPCSACYIILPIYLKEISDKDLRGAVGSLLILCRNVGYLASYIGADMLQVNLMLWLGFCVPAILFIVFLFMPETPEFLIKQGKFEEAKEVMAWLRGVPPSCPTLQREVENVYQEHQVDMHNASSLFRDRLVSKAFLMTFIIKIGQQFDGYLIVLMYAGFVFEQAADSIQMKLSPNKQVMVVGTVQLLGSIVATSLVENTGRKMLLVTTSFIVGLGMLTLSVWFYMTSVGVWLPGWVPVIAICLCIFADAAGFQPISYVIITDLFTFEYRGTVSSIVNICAKASNFVQMKWFNSLNEAIGIQWTFLFFAIVTFSACAYIVAFFPETKEKTVDEIYQEFDRKKKNTKAKPKV